MASGTFTFPEETHNKLKKLKAKTGISVNAWMIIAVNMLLKEKENIIK